MNGLFFRASYWTGTRQIEKSWVKWFGYFPHKIPSNYITVNPLLRPHVKKTTSVVYRGYFVYMAARRYKFSLRVLKIFHKCSGPSEWVKYFSAQEDKFCISKQPWNVLTILLNTHQWYTKPFHFTNSFYAGKDTIYFKVAFNSNSDLFTCEIKCYFLMWRYHVFVQKFTWLISLVCVFTIKWFNFCNMNL